MRPWRSLRLETAASSLLVSTIGLCLSLQKIIAPYKFHFIPLLFHNFTIIALSFNYWTGNPAFCNEIPSLFCFFVKLLLKARYYTCKVFFWKRLFSMCWKCKDKCLTRCFIHFILLLKIYFSLHWNRFLKLESVLPASSFWRGICQRCWWNENICLPGWKSFHLLPLKWERNGPNFPPA